MHKIFRGNARKGRLVVLPMGKNNSEGCLILRKLDYASLSKMVNAQNLPPNVNMLMDKLNLEN